MGTPRTDAAIAAAYAECGMSPEEGYGPEEWAYYFETAHSHLEALCRELEDELAQAEDRIDAWMEEAARPRD